MQTRQDAYPNLARYLKSWRTSYELRKLKRPEEWVFYAGIFAAAFVSSTSWVASVAIIVAAISLQVVFRRMRGVRSKELFKEVLSYGTHIRLQKAIKRGTLEDLVGGQAAAVLESCAELAQRSYAARIRVALNGPGLSKHYKDFLQDCRRVVESEMEETTRVLQMSLTMKIALADSEIADLRRHQSNLRMLAEESEHLARAMESPKSDHDIRETLARMRAIREAEEELHQTLGQP